MSADQPSAGGNYTAYNYCLLFLDVHGQRSAFRDQSWLPTQNTKVDRDAFIEQLRKTVLPVRALQRRVDTMVSGLTSDPNHPFRMSLPPEQQKVWDEMQITRIVKQHRSDGIAAYVNLGDSRVKCSMNGVYGLFGLAGMECLLGLALKQPRSGSTRRELGTRVRTRRLVWAGCGARLRARE